MVEIYGKSSDQKFHKSLSRSSSPTSNKDYQKRYNSLNGHITAVCNKKCAAQSSDAEMGLFSNQSFGLGDVIFSEPPALAFSSDGFCVFCSDRHSELRIPSSVLESRLSDMGDQHFSPNYINFVKQSKTAPTNRKTKPACSEAVRMLKKLSTAIAAIEDDADSVFRCYDYRKLRLALLYIFRLSAEIKLAPKSADHAEELSKLDSVLKLHSECSCESLKSEERRFNAAQKIKESVPASLAQCVDVEELTEVLSVIDTNCFEVNVPGRGIGSALYLVGSLVNHSCDPNCCFRFHMIALLHRSRMTTRGSFTFAKTWGLYASAVNAIAFHPIFVALYNSAVFKRTVSFSDRPIRRNIKQTLYIFYIVFPLAIIVTPSLVIACAFIAPIHAPLTRQLGDAMPHKPEMIRRALYNNCSMFDPHCSKNYRLRKYRMLWERKNGLEKKE